MFSRSPEPRYMPRGLLWIAWLLALLMLAMLLAGCAGMDEPDLTSCRAGLTSARLQAMMDWTATAMDVPTTPAIPVECASDATLEKVYRQAGAEASQARLAAYLPNQPAALVHWRRTHPRNRDHLIVHEYCHHLHRTSGLVLFLPKAVAELDCEAVHALWMKERP